MSAKSKLQIGFYVLLSLTFINCGLGQGIPGGNDIGVQIVEGEVEVETVFIRTGISSNTVISGDIQSTVYVGRSFYQEVDSDYDLSFNPSRNFLTLDESYED